MVNISVATKAFITMKPIRWKMEKHDPCKFWKSYPISKGISSLLESMLWGSLRFYSVVFCDTVVGIGVVRLLLASCCCWAGVCSIIVVGLLCYFFQPPAVTDLCFGPDLASHFADKENCFRSCYFAAFAASHIVPVSQSWSFCLCY